jgi:type IV pilus assembly protein PilA
MNRKTSHVDCRRARRTVVPNGFTLMELLIVIAVILILMLMAMKTVGGMKIKANELSAINSIRVINSAEGEYDSDYGALGFACDLKSLGGVPGSAPPTPTSAQLLDNDLASSGYKSGYLFKISNCEKVTVNGTDRITGYVLTAVPASPGKTGNRGFCTDQFGGNPKYDPTGGTNCTQSLQ